MLKLEILKVEQLNRLLRNRGLSIVGNKAHKIAKLMELNGSDEIDSEELVGDGAEGLEPWHADMEDLREIVANLAKSVSEMAVSINRLAHPTTAPQVGVASSGIQRNIPSASAIRSISSETDTPSRGHASHDTRHTTPFAAQLRHPSGSQDVIGSLPDFDPLKRTLSSHQFISKVEQLQRLYMWSDEMILFAVQHKLKGIAKDWLDAQPVFKTWTEFVNEFSKDFPSAVNVADIHRDLMKRRRKQNEPLIEYYYIMLTIGRRGKLDDISTNSYIINGLNDSYLTRSLLALNFQTCNELLNSLENVSSMLSTIPPRAATAGPSEVAECSNEISRSVSGRRNIKCFNCNEIGHMAVKCTQPQRKTRCSNCSKIGHDAKDCRLRKSTVAKVEQSIEKGAFVPPVMKQIRLAGQTYSAFVDTGSDYSLIKESSVPKDILRKTSIKQLKGFGGSVVESTNMITVDMQMDEHEIKAELQIVPDEFLSQAILLGRDVLCRRNQRVILESGVLQVKSEPPDALNINKTLSDVHQTAISDILIDYADCFAEDVSRIGRCKDTYMEIEVTTSKPIVGKRYQVPFAQRDKLSEIVDNLLKYNIVRPSTSPHAASVVLVAKANGEMRMCVDYRALNAVTVKKQFPAPVVEEQLSQLARNKYFTTLDMTAGYYQIPLSEDSKQFTAFLTPDGLYEHNVMPFGLVNASMHFQEMMTQIIRRLKHRKQIVNYVDEVVIATRTVEEGMLVLQEFLEAMKQAGLTLRPSKCVFMGTTVNFLGHVVSSDGIRPGENKTKCIEEFPRPTNATEVRQFLGVTGFFRKFVKNYSDIARSLTNLLKKDEVFRWQSEQEDAFGKLKAAITSEPVLVLFDASKYHEIHTDASSVGLSGILLQREDDGMKPVSYYSRRCSEAESRYASHELEVLAIVETLERFRVYLLGTRFRVITDCNAVATTKATTPLPPRIARWWLRLQEFDFDCVHRPGARMQHVDGMSRIPTLPSKEMSSVAENILKVSSIDDDWIFAMQMQDDKLKDIVMILKGESDEKGNVVKQTNTDYAMQKGRLHRKVGDQRKLVVPQLVRWRITKACHDDAGHFGVEKTIDRISKDFWFPRMRRYVKSYIAACPECCFNKVKGGKSESQLHVMEVLPIPFRCINLDHLGPFPKSKRGNVYIIVLVCSFSKYTILRALRNTKTAPVIVVLREMMSIFGQPLRITSDRGTAFTSREFESFVSSYGIQHVKTAVRTPRANGQAERVNKTLLSSLKCSTANDRDWDVTLTNLQWSINTQRNSTTKFRPVDLVFNFDLKDVSHNRIIQAIQDEPLDVVDIDLRRREAADNIAEERRKWKIRYDRKHQAPHRYAEGDLVVLDFVPQATGESHKLDPCYKGPYIVSKVLSFDRYVVEDLPDQPLNRRRYSNVVSSDHMKPWCALSPDIDWDDGSEGDVYDNVSSNEDEVSGEAELSTATLQHLDEDQFFDRR